MSELDNSKLAKIIRDLKDKSIICDLWEIFIKWSTEGEKGGQWGTSYVKNIDLKVDDNTVIENKLVIKFLAENISKGKNESKRFKRFKQTYYNILLLKDKSYIIPHIYFWKYVYDEETTVPFTIMMKAETPILEPAEDFDQFEYKFNRLLDCIDYIHKMGIIHRDLKPDNIFTFNWELVLADLDISKMFIPETLSNKDHVKLFETKDSDFVWNRSYSSPEQEQKWWEATKKSDWYSLWWLINYLITWKAPVKWQFTIDYSSYSAWYKRYEKLVKSLLSVSPNDRPWSKQEILALIDTWFTNDIWPYPFPSSIEENLTNLQYIINKYTNYDNRYEVLDNHKDINSFLKDILNWINLDDKFLSYTRWSEWYCIINKIKKLDSPWDENLWLFKNLELNISKIHLYSWRVFWEQFFIIESKVSDENIVNKDNINWDEEYILYKDKSYPINKRSKNWYLDIDWEKINMYQDFIHVIRVLEKDLFIFHPEKLLLHQQNMRSFNELYTKSIQNCNVDFSNLNILPYKPYNDLIFS